MAVPTAGGTPLASRVFDGVILALGGLIAVAAFARMATDGTSVLGPELLCVPLIVVMAHFPILLEQGGHRGIEVGFDSSVLIFLVCTVEPAPALALWSIGVVGTQVASRKRPASMRFNIGVGIVAGAVAAAVITGTRGDAVGTPRELLAVALGAAAYFAVDYVLSCISVALEQAASLRAQLLQPGTAIAVVCFVPFDSLGYLGAVITRATPWWTLGLLAVPLITLLVATWALTRGRENARRLEVLFQAAVRAQTLSHAPLVVGALLADARRLLGSQRVEVRTTPPAEQEVGARLREGGERERWVVAPVLSRARSSSAADQQALEAMAAVASDAFARLRLTADMTHLASHDVLTDLPNRALLLDRAEYALHTAQSRGIAVLLCDLDGFKPVNDRFGHAAGDALLVDVAQRLTSCVRDSDMVARLGGDEFAILLENIQPRDVEATCSRILTSLGTGAEVAGHHVPLSASIGIAVSGDGASPEELLRNADMAMYTAKALGKNRYVRYRQSLGRERLKRLELVESLRAAITARELTLAYQPVVRLDTGRIVGLEALARWTCAGETVSPDEFIGAAEDSGLMVALGDLVLELAAADAEVLRKAAGRPLEVAVNISAQQLADPSFVAKVEETVATMGGGLALEITERDFVDYDRVSRETMAALSARGVRFAIDDFGVGFSSIGYLRHMPVGTIKTDMSFSADIDDDERACALLRSITMMGQALSLDVVVEGIERPGQLEHLREHVGATHVQGYLLHRPMRLSEAVEVLRADRRADSSVALGSPVG